MTVSALKIFESKELIPHEIPSTIKKPIKIFEKKEEIDDDLEFVDSYLSHCTLTAKIVVKSGLREKYLVNSIEPYTKGKRSKTGSTLQ